MAIMTIGELRVTLHKIVDVLDYYNEMTYVHDCNDCIKKTCEYMPKPGQLVRINCPLWEGETNGTV